SHWGGFSSTSCAIAKTGSKRKSLQSEAMVVIRTSVHSERFPLYSWSGDNPKLGGFLSL
ncbi:unnamed protein product, partial [Staurois parvus]